MKLKSFILETTVEDGQLFSVSMKPGEDGFERLGLIRLLAHGFGKIFKHLGEVVFHDLDLGVDGRIVPAVFDDGPRCPSLV